jgi:hypothetical protein
MGAILGTFGIIFAVLLGSFHQIYVKPALKTWGIRGRDNLPNIGSGDCITESALEACEGPNSSFLPLSLLPQIKHHDAE